MFTVSYQDKYYRHWDDDNIFRQYEDAKEYLCSKGFSQKNGIYERGKSGWCDGLVAYVLPRKFYKN